MEQKLEKPKLEKSKEVSIAAIRLSTVKFKIIGKTPLLMDKMPEETLREIQDKQTGVKKSAKKIRDIEKEIDNAVHKLPEEGVGYPAAGFKSGMIEATSFVGDKMFSKKLIRGIKILNAINGLVPITFKKKDILIHNVGSNTKHTPQFHEWEADLEIMFDANNVSEADLAILINYAGFYSGIGMWSPRCKSGGDFGSYAIKSN